MGAPLVSVIVPCYNAGAWLDETFDCLERQSHRELEILAIDDGSTDDTWERLERRTDPRLERLRQENRGAAAARNAGLARARGDYLQFLDADDVIAPDKIAVQLEALRELGPRWVASSLWGRFRGDVRDTQWQVPWAIPRQRGIDWLVHAWADGDMMAPHGWLVPRAMADAVGPWNPKAGINDDGEYFARVLLAADGVVQVPAARVHYRSGNASYSQRKDRWAWESLLNSYELCARHLLASENSPRVRAAIVARLETFEYLAYPRFPDLVARAEAISEELGLPPRRPHGGGGASRTARRVLGWKLTRRLGALLRR